MRGMQFVPVFSCITWIMPLMLITHRLAISIIQWVGSGVSGTAPGSASLNSLLSPHCNIAQWGNPVGNPS